MHARTMIMLAGCLLAAPLQAQADPGAMIPLPLHIGGRVGGSASAPGVYVHQWPGTYFEANFKGTAVTIRLNDGVNKLDIWLDGKLVDTETKPGSGDIDLGPFKDGSHTIRVEKRTESQGAVAAFSGFFVHDAANILPAPPARVRQIEFIGDSYTVGYGNISPKRECHGDDVWATTDTPLAFGPLTAKHYDADYQINAISGHGIVRNYNGSPGDPVPVAYDFTFLDKSSANINPSWQPQIIAIGLGTNDFTTPLHDGEKWKTRDALHADYEATYVAFVKHLRVEYPNAFFILMATDQVEGEIQAEARKVTAALQASGEHRIDFLPMNGLGFEGCDWHPSTADDARVSQSLITFIDAHADIWQGK